MKKLSCKVITCALVAAMVLPVVACNKKSGQEKAKSPAGKKISADSPWFEDSMIKVKPELDLKKEIEYIQHNIAGVDENYMVIHSSGSYKMPGGDNINWQAIDLRDYAINTISVFDRNSGKIVSTFDITSELPKNGYIEKVTYKDGKVTAVATEYDEVTYIGKRVSSIYDPATGKLTDKKESSGEGGGEEYDRTFETAGYTIGMKSAWDDSGKSYVKLFISKGGESVVATLKSNDRNYYDVPVVFKTADNKVVAAVGADKEPVFYEVDLQTGNATEAPAGSYDWISVYDIYSVVYGADDTVYYTSGTGVFKLDIKNKKTVEIFNYSWCSVSRSFLSGALMVECSDDKLVLCGEKFSQVAMGKTTESDFFVVTLNRAEKNPHAGKTIIELYSSGGYVEENISNAISKFNDSSSTHFIEVHDRYKDVNGDIIDYSKISSDDEMQQADLNFNAKMSNELAMDILNGEGPDILLNCSNYGQLNNSNYLADLSKYVGTLDSDKYFTNIVDAAKIDGKLYQLPICYMVSGIFTDAKYAGKSGVGFTTAEYQKFLNDALNGKDVINYGQAMYFTKLFTAMSDKFITDGKVDFSGPEFAELADFVKNNVPEKARSWYDQNNTDNGVAYAVGVTAFKGDSADQNQVAAYTTFYGLSGYFYQMGSLNGASGFFGIPSTDGRGPTLESYVSVAVSAQSKSIDACGEFIKMLMSDDIQESLASTDNLVLSRKAFRAAAKETVEYFNGEGGRMLFSYDPATGQPRDNALKFSEKNVDDFEKILLSISRMNSADAAINLILIEEMPAYFSGQKSLDAVIKIAQDRAQKVISERG